MQVCLLTSKLCMMTRWVMQQNIAHVIAVLVAKKERMDRLLRVCALASPKSCA